MPLRPPLLLRTGRAKDGVDKPWRQIVGGAQELSLFVHPDQLVMASGVVKDVGTGAESDRPRQQRQRPLVALSHLLQVHVVAAPLDAVGDSLCIDTGAVGADVVKIGPVSAIER